MTKPKFETLYCSVCGTEVGKKPGRGAVTGLICDDPVCQIVGPPGLAVVRDSIIVALFRAGVSAVVLGAAAKMSRQRIYQIIEDYTGGK